MMELSQAISYIVERLLGDWVSFRIALQHGMGGANSKEKEAVMCEELTEYLAHDSNVAALAVERYIEEILDEDFNTVIDDGTVPQIATLMVNLSQLCKGGMIQEAISQLPSVRPPVPVARPELSRTANGEHQVDASQITEITDQMADLGSRSRRRRSNQPDEDGWVTVHKTNK